MRIELTLCDKYGCPVEINGAEVKETRISFFFDDGDNWHMQLKDTTSKRELKESLLGVAELIDKTTKGLL